MILKKSPQLTQMIGMSPKDATGLKEVPLVESYPPEDTLPEDGLYCYLLQSSKEHEDQCKRATDRIWSKQTYRLSKIVEDSGNQVMYYLSDGNERAFVLEELMLIPKTQSCLPITSKNGNIYPMMKIKLCPLDII